MNKLASLFIILRRCCPSFALFCCILATLQIASATVFVGDTNTQSISEYAAAGTATTFASGLNQPVGLAVDESGNLYEADAYSGSIYKFTPTGIRTTFATVGTDRVLGLVFDGAGNLFASTFNPTAVTSAILKFTPAGTKSTFSTGTTRDRGMVFDSAGNLYVADLDGGNIYKYTPAAVRTTFATGIIFPTGLAIDQSGTIFVCSQGIGIYEVSPQGVVSLFSNNAPDPRWLAFDSAGNLYVTDVGDGSGAFGQGSIFVFSPDGTRSTFASDLNFPLGIAVNGAHASFFNDEVSLGNGAYYLEFSDGTPFGYYSYLTDPHYIFHFDLGYEYIFDAVDELGGVYFYDFTSGHFFYTSPSFPFPYLYDFTLNSVLYYYPDTQNPGRYTTNPRYFYNYGTSQIFTQ